MDIAYILSLGFTVFAVEGVAKAVETLSEENGFNLKFYENESIYRSPDGNLEIYLGDLFTCPIEKYGPFDYVWDKGSLTAIDEEMRPSYKAVMQKSVSQGTFLFSVLVECFFRNMGGDKNCKML